MMYFLAFALAVAVSATLTPKVRRYAVKHGYMDKPDGIRKIHSSPVARLGGVAIAVSFVATVLLFLPMSRQLAGLLGGIAVLVAVGVVDDMRGLGPWVKLGWQFVAAAVALAGGIGIIGFASPFGGFVHLDWGRTLVELGPFSFHITPLANALSLLWMVGVINVVNFLDGLDGLAGGVSGIAAFTLFLLSISDKVNQPAAALLAIVLVGAIVGFLPFNFYPARIFMGDSGSYFLGITLAMLAIYSGAKLATAALVLGFTIIDGLWTVARRLYKRKSPFTADRLHLHHLFLDAGFSQRQTVLILYFVAASFGIIALNSGSFAKLVALVSVAALTLLLTGALLVVMRRNSK